jgi:hypothetical protein
MTMTRWGRRGRFIITTSVLFDRIYYCNSNYRIRIAIAPSFYVANFESQCAALWQMAELCQQATSHQQQQSSNIIKTDAKMSLSFCPAQL